jgi:hypothetical protein
MSRHERILALATAVLAMASFGRGSAEASLIWDGDASKGTGVFKGLELHGGSVTAVNDSTQGRVFRIYKQSGSDRCETRGIKVNGTGYTFRNGQTVYFGWRSKLSTTVNNNANFQWKSYGSHIQNWPVVLKMVSGKATIIQRQPGNVVSTIWSRSISANQWNHYILGLKLSSETRGGWVQLWFNGARQTFNNGSQSYACRTFDDVNEPKWGVYGASGSTVINYVDGLKMGTASGDVD